MPGPISHLRSRLPRASPLPSASEVTVLPEPEDSTANDSESSRRIPSRIPKRRSLCLSEQKDGMTATRAREWGKAAAEGGVLALSVAKNATDWNPLLKGVLGGVAEVIDICRVSKLFTR